jgi:hypothetical protein
MHIKSERGQSFVLIALAVAAAVLLIMAVTGNLPGMKKGADTIAKYITDNNGNTIDDGLYMSWKGSQAIFPNKHAVQEHGDDAYRSTDCYNRNGAFHVMKLRNEFHLFCRDNDGGIRDVILERRGNTNKFDFVNAFSPKLDTGNVWQDILNWMVRKGAGKGSMPSDAIIIIDGIIP